MPRDSGQQTCIKKKQHSVLHTHKLSLKSSHFTHPPNAKDIFIVHFPPSYLQLAPDQGLQPADQPTDLRRRCEEEAQEVVRQANTLSTGQLCVESKNLTDLISRLTAILLQIKVKSLHKIAAPVQYLCAEL